jgi:subfamily B ATP-binding cassette protein MsbA
MLEKLKIVISAGEQSGDERAAELVRALKVEREQISFSGMGGKMLRAEGVDCVVDSEAVGGLMGFGEVLSSLRRIRAALKSMERHILEVRPDILVLVDYADFNMRLAKFAKSRGIKVYYYIPPKVWLWRRGRVAKLQRITDGIGTIFPPENEFYRSKNISHARYLGHPLVTDMRREEESDREAGINRKSFWQRHGLEAGGKVLAIFPGSRRQEVLRHLGVLKEVVAGLKAEFPELQCVVVLASSLSRTAMPEIPGATIIHGESRRALRFSDAALLKCGTSNMEAAIAGTPAAVFYKVSAVNAIIARRVAKLPAYSMVNIIRPGTVCELMQEEMTPRALMAEAEKLLYDGRYSAQLRHKYSEIAASLSLTQSAAVGAAQHVLETIAAPARGRVAFRKIFRFLKPYKTQFSLALLAMFVFGATEGVIPVMLKQILDGIFANKNENLLYLLPLGLVLFAGLRAALDFAQQYMLSSLGHKVVRDVRQALHSHLLKMQPGYFVVTSGADLLSRFTSDVVMIRTLLTDTLGSLIRDFVKIVALIGAAIYLDPWLALIALLVFPVAGVPIARFGRKLRRLSKQGQDAIGETSGTILESFSGNRVVKISGREDFERKRFAAANFGLTDTFIKSEWVRALSGPINELMASIAISGVVIYGGMAVIHGTRSQGDFIGFLAAVLFTYDPFKRLTRVGNTAQQALSGAERILEVLEQRPSIVDPSEPKELGTSNAIEIREVSFSYGNGVSVLNNVSLTVREGQTVALVGFSGSGKSTLVDLLPRFIDPQEGQVLLGGVDVREVRLAELRSRIAVVQQHTFLFNDTIYNNIAYGAPVGRVVTREEIEVAARAAYAYEFITALPNGFETKVGESGLALSGGERQRIAIARAILKDAPILILDEATAALDNRAEREVQLALERLAKGRTTIVIAHRLSTVRSADLVCVMRDGQIIERGSHSELLARGQEYSKLYAMQFEEREAAAEVGIQ